MKERAKSDGSDTSPVIAGYSDNREETDIEGRFTRDLVTGICELTPTLVVLGGAV